MRRCLLPAALLTALLAALLTGSLLAPAPAHAAGNDYPYAGDSTWHNDPWGFTMRQCVSFAAWRVHQGGLDLNNAAQGWGDAGHWDVTAARLHFAVTNVPRVGAVAQWHAGERSPAFFSSNVVNGSLYAGGYGHVGVVSMVYPDRSALVEQYNLYGNRAYAVTRVFAPRYLYLFPQVITPYGAIGALWRALGGPRSYLGNATRPEGPVPGGRGQAFQHGVIYWSGATGAHAMRGLILAHYLAVGGPAAVGLPTTDERVTPDGVGRYNHFPYASIYWTPTTAARLVKGDIRQRWAALGWERGALGYPTSDEFTPAAGYRENTFQRGQIVWSGRTYQTRVTFRR